MNNKSYIATNSTLQNIKSVIATLLSEDELKNAIYKIQNGEFSTVVEREYGSILLGNKMYTTISATGSGIGYFFPTYYVDFTIDGESISNVVIPQVGFEFNNSISVKPSTENHTVNSDDSIFYVICLY